MIFRRNNDANKTVTAQSQRTPNTSGRREPDLTPRAAQTLTPPSTVQQPLSPIAMAQTRRPATPAAASYTRHQDQLRKLTVGRDIALNGEIATCDHLVVEGTVQATIKGGQILEIAECGSFSGVVDIEHADIAGKFDGDLTVRDKLTLRATARVTGTIRYTRLQVDTGAQLNGQINVLAVQQPVQTAPTYSTAQTNDMSAQQNSYSLSSVIEQSGFLKASA